MRSTQGELEAFYRAVKPRLDEAIQYLYTTLSSVPNVLLIAACVLMVQVFLDKNPDLFETGLERLPKMVQPLDRIFAMLPRVLCPPGHRDFQHSHSHGLETVQRNRVPFIRRLSGETELQVDPHDLPPLGEQAMQQPSTLSSKRQL